MIHVLTFFTIKILVICAQESTVVDLSEFGNTTEVQNLENNTEQVDVSEFENSTEMYNLRNYTESVGISEFENSTEMQNLRNNTAQGVVRRYGFQQTMTRACKNFAKTFMCVRKCLDYKFDIAHSDRHCKCTCYKHAEKATFTMPLSGVTNGSKWKSGPPTVTFFVTPKFPPTYEDEIPSEEEEAEHENSGEKQSGEEKEGKGSEKEEDKDTESKGDGGGGGGGGKPVTDADGNFVTREVGQTVTEEGGGEEGGGEKVKEGGESKAEGEGEETKAEEGGGE